jgi:murein DD-endopeptidase MepM/ murein hydrolase activator NlpD
MTLMKPWPRGEHIRSAWGPRVHPITGKRKHHRGVDVAYSGDIYAPADGVIVHKGADLNKRTGGGYTLIIRHDAPRVWTVYYHLREPSPLLKGTRVTRGEVIGHTGTTGASTGVHLHFETRKSRRWGSDFDPQSILSHEHASEKPARAARPDRENPRVQKPSRVGTVSPGLAAWSRSWMKRGAMFGRGN